MTSRVASRHSAHIVRRLRVTVVMVLLPGLLTACQTWQMEPFPLAQRRRWDQPVRVVLATTQQRIFASAWVERDTLRGRPREVRADSVEGYAIQRILRVDVLEPDDARTNRLFISASILPAFILLGIYMYKLGTSGPW